jgi:preprotein translocase subunit YajC
MYLGFAIFFTFEAVQIFSTNSKKAGLFMLFAIMAVFMFFFKRRFRKKRFENQDKK